MRGEEPGSENGEGSGYKARLEVADRLMGEGRGAEAVTELARALEVGGEEARQAVNELLNRD